MVALRSQSGEKGRPSSTSLSPWKRHSHQGNMNTMYSDHLCVVFTSTYYHLSIINTAKQTLHSNRKRGGGAVEHLFYHSSMYTSSSCGQIQTLTDQLWLVTVAKLWMDNHCSEEVFIQQSVVHNLTFDTCIITVCVCVCVCVYLSKELLHQTVSPAVVQRPGFGWMTDVCSVKHQRQNLHFVYTGERGQTKIISLQSFSVINCD